jgi:hypothetical protein
MQSHDRWLRVKALDQFSNRHTHLLKRVSIPSLDYARDDRS